MRAAADRSWVRRIRHGQLQVAAFAHEPRDMSPSGDTLSKATSRRGETGELVRHEPEQESKKLFGIAGNRSFQTSRAPHRFAASATYMRQFTS
jgi:hypothetical protein